MSVPRTQWPESHHQSSLWVRTFRTFSMMLLGSRCPSLCLTSYVLLHTETREPVPTSSAPPASLAYREHGSRSFPQFRSPQLQSPSPNLSPKILNSRHKQFLHFKLCTILSSEMKPQAVPLHPALDVNQPFVQCLHSVHTTCHLSLRGCLTYQTSCLGIAVLIFKSTLVYLRMAPKCKSSDDGNSDVLKRIHTALPLHDRYARAERKHYL